MEIVVKYLGLLRTIGRVQRFQGAEVNDFAGDLDFVVVN